MYHIKNLVFEGGGVKGIAYIGALEVLEERGIPGGVERVGGTSAGAINAVLLGLDYSLKEMRDILWQLNFNEFMDDSGFVFRDAWRFFKRFGWHKGDYFKEWISGLVAAKTGNPRSTFREVHGNNGFRELYFVGTNLSTGFADIYSYEHTPDLPIVDAVRTSMSLPLFFAAARNRRGDVMVDGGMLNNYPVKLFDRRRFVEAHCIMDRPHYVEHNREIAADDDDEWVYNQETLGFRLDTATQIDVFKGEREPVRHSISGFPNYVKALIRTLMNAQESWHLHSDDWDRTIYIDTLDVETTDFDLSDERKDALAESGRTHTREYFEWYDNPESTPWNRPEAAVAEVGGSPSEEAMPTE